MNIIGLNHPITKTRGGFGGTTIEESKQQLQFGLYSAKNFIIGGNFDMNPFGRGFDTELPFVHYMGNGEWLADMWSYHYSGPARVFVIRGTDSPSVAQSHIFAENCLETQIEIPEPVGAAGSYYYHRTRVETPDPLLVVNSMTLSFWVRSSAVGIYSVRFLQNDGADVIWISEYEIFAQNTWEFKTITAEVPPLVNHLYIDFVIACGLAYTTSNLNNWYAPGGLTMIASYRQVNGVGVINDGRFKLQFVQLESGLEYTGYELRDYAEEQYLCMRYYEKSYAIAVRPGTATTDGQIFAACLFDGSALTRHAFSEFVPFKVQKPDSFSGVLQFYTTTGVDNKWLFYNASGASEELILDGITPDNSNGFYVRSSGEVADKVACRGHYVAKWEF